MDVRLVPALERDKPLVRRLLELDSRDFSEIDGRDLGPHGEYGYAYLDDYWLPDENRHPFLIDVDGQIGGCALIRAGMPHQFGEFFVGRKYRRRGVGNVKMRASDPGERFGTGGTSSPLVYGPDRFRPHAVGELATARHRRPCTCRHGADSTNASRSTLGPVRAGVGLSR